MAAKAKYDRYLFNINSELFVYE